METDWRYSRSNIEHCLGHGEGFWGRIWEEMDWLCEMDFDQVADITTDYPCYYIRRRDLENARGAGLLNASDIARHDAILSVAEWADRMIDEIFETCHTIEDIRAVVAKYRAQYGPEADTPLA